MGPIPLTDKQEKVWRFIASCERSPSYHEIRDGAGIRAIKGIQRTLDRLEELGYIRRTKHRKRGIELLVRPDGQRVTRFRGLSDFTDRQLEDELERRRIARALPRRRNSFADARIGSTMLLDAIERAGVRP
jgi:SOS-response transcriptional repressor LexA